MGCTYDVELSMFYKDASKVVALAKQYITKPKARKTVFGHSFGYDTVDAVVKTVLAGQQGMFEKEEEKDGATYISFFDATYSWNGVLAEFFEAIRPALDIGSYINVWIDGEDSWTEVVSDKPERREAV